VTSCNADGFEHCTKLELTTLRLAGGLRFHPSVTLSIIKFLGFEQVCSFVRTQLLAWTLTHYDVCYQLFIRFGLTCM
jgi:hypothetical protein